MSGLAVLLLLGLRIASAQDIAGDWIGTLSRPAGDLRVALHVTKGESGFTGTLDSIDQGVRGLPLDFVKVVDSKVTFESASAQISYEGKVDAGATTIDGMVTGGSGTRPLVFRRGKFPEVQHKPGKPSDIDGDWAGALKADGNQLDLVFHIVNTEDGLTATIDIPAQNVKGAPASTVKRDGSSLLIDWKAFGSVFEGQIAADRSKLEGAMTQRGASMPITLIRKKQ